MEIFKFETVQPASVSVTESEAITGRLDELITAVALIERRQSVQERFVRSIGEINSTALVKAELGGLRHEADQHIRGHSKPESLFAEGMVVNHGKFGDGVVRNVNDRRLDIEFEEFGRKRVLDAFVKIVS